MALGGWGQAAETAEQDRQDRDVDRQHFRAIYTALQSYRKDHAGEWPDWLSDLVPAYLASTNLLMCPVEVRTGRTQTSGIEDPKVHISYLYEFNGLPAGQISGAAPSGGEWTMKKWKATQMDLFGQAVPVVRCWLHAPVLNLAVGGEIFESETYWETDPRTVEAMKRSGWTGPPAAWRRIPLRVVDNEKRQAVPGAEVDFTVSMPGSSLPLQQAVTDAEGQVELRLPTNNASNIQIVVRRAPYLQYRAVFAESDAQITRLPDARLQQSVSVGGVVRNAAGQPVAGAQVQYVHPVTRQPTTHVTDSQGRWTGTGFPSVQTKLAVEIRHPEYRTATVEVDGDTTGTTLERRQIWTGKVVSAKTGKPVPAFTAEPGYEYYRTVRFESQEAVAGQDGKFVLRLDESAPLCVRVKAPGFACQVSPWIEGPAAEAGLNFQLAPATVLEGTIRLPGGSPASGAEVAVTGGSGNARLGKGTLESDDQPVVQTDARGAFKLEFGPEAAGIALVHREGFAWLPLPVKGRTAAVTLQAWATLEIQRQFDLQIMTGGGEQSLVVTPELMLVNLFQSAYVGVLTLDLEAFSAKGDAARTAVRFVPPGRRWLWRPVPVEPTWVGMAENIVFNGSDFMATAGQTNRLTLADARTSLRGKLVAPERLDWGGYLGRLTAYPAQGGQPTQVFFTLQSQGRFRVVDLPESVAKLELALYRPPIPVGVGKIGPDILAKASGAANAQDGPQQFNLQDLGPIEVDLAVPVGVGDPAPELSLKTPAGRPVTLADFRGKYVLVDFSTRWCGARQGSEPFLAQAHKEHGRGGRLLVLEANLDADPEAARHYLTGRRVPWMQSTAGDWADAMGLSRFGAAGLPSAFLIGPDGKVLARDLYGSGILKAVNQHLGRK